MLFNLEKRMSDSLFVEEIWHTQSERGGAFISTAAIHWEMVLMRYKGKTTFTVRGPETEATSAPLPAETEWLGITFKLGTFMPNLLPGSLLDGHDVNLPQTSSNSFWLYGSAWELP